MVPAPTLIPGPPLSPARHRLGHAALLAVAALAIFSLAAALRGPLEGARHYQPAFELTDNQTEQLNQSPFAVILGEVRASMADLMWIKTERYMHRGVAFEPHIDADELARNGDAVAVKPAKPLSSSPLANLMAQHPGEQTIVPPQDRDYRGFVGEIQREIQPWQGPNVPHKHAGGDELIPWYRMLTLSNPHHWRGYMTGAWWISQQQAKNPSAGAEALSFIEEGIQNNPEIFQLHLVRGRLLLAQKRAEEALSEFRRAEALALKFRSPDGKPNPPIWNDSDEEDFAPVERYIPLVLWRNLSRPAEALQSVDRAIGRLPNDRPLKDLKTSLEAAR